MDSQLGVEGLGKGCNAEGKGGVGEVVCGVLGYLMYMFWVRYTIS